MGFLDTGNRGRSRHRFKISWCRERGSNPRPSDFPGEVSYYLNPMSPTLYQAEPPRLIKSVNNLSIIRIAQNPPNPASNGYRRCLNVASPDIRKRYGQKQSGPKPRERFTRMSPRSWPRLRLQPRREPRRELRPSPLRRELRSPLLWALRGWIRVLHLPWRELRTCGSRSS